MIHLKTKHPEFDMKMEVLASLPRFPTTIRLIDLRDDLGTGYRQPNYFKYPSIRECIGELCNAGYKIEMIMDGGWNICVDPIGWEAVKRNAQDYWDRIYKREYGSCHQKKNGRHRLSAASA